jgi:protein TorT
VIQARIAVDQAVRILDGKEVQKHVGPEIIVLDRSTISFFDYLSALPPRGFEPVMAVN